jgi:mannose-1-phosphate guanylyltransferase
VPIDACAPAAYRRLLDCSASRDPVHGVAGVILAVGRGRRLAPFTDRLPKPLLPVLRLPIMLWAMAQLRQAGVSRVCANVSHLAEQFEPVRALCARAGPALDLVTEPRPTGPLGGLLSCRDALPRVADCVVVNGDALSDIDLAALVGTHRREAAELTIAVTAVPDASRFGVLDVDGDDRIVGMREKPADVRATELVHTGVYVIGHDLLARLDRPAGPGEHNVDVLVRDLIAAGRPPVAYRHGGFWSDLGTPADLLVGNLRYLADPWLARLDGDGRPTATGRSRGGTVPPPDVRVDGDVLLGADVVVDAGARLDTCVVGSDCRVGAGASVHRSVLLAGARVGAGEQVVDTVVG